MNAGNPLALSIYRPRSQITISITKKEILMLAEIAQPPSPVSTPDPPALTATLFYNSDGGPESKFTWVAETGQPFLNVTEADTTVTITLQSTQQTAIFNVLKPINFISKDNNFTLLSQSGNELSFRINNLPLSYLNPLVLSFNVDDGAVSGISSPPFFLVLPSISPSSTSVGLQYSIDDGVFTLDSMAVVASLDVLTNTSTLPFDITFNLSTVPADPPVIVRFNPDQPLLGPSWLLPATVVTPTELKVTITSEATRFTSFQFVIDVGELTVTSPDPILINSTIGDG
jgi:hypothetical protein